jgi:hypothetical protein
MRKLLGPGLLLCAVLAGCETKSPSGPSGNTPTTTTTTTSVPVPGPSTTTSTTTTTAVLGSLARRYTAFQPPPNVPSDMTLFFELIQAAPLAGVTGFTSGRNAVTENEYKVTGVYIMGNGTTGTVIGELGGSLNPLETGGDFKGSLTATMPSGCNALRDFSGVITSQTLQWTGGATGTVTNPCSPNPLTAFSSMSMLRFDAGAPLPTPPSTTSSISTTTTTVACTYSLSSPSGSAPNTGGTQSVNINTQAGCAWSAQSFADWITIRPPYGGSGPATVSYDVAPATSARQGTLLIAGIQFTVSQTGPPDLEPYSPDGITADDYCRSDDTGGIYIAVRNIGVGPAPASSTKVVFTTPSGPYTAFAPTPALAVGGNVTTLDVKLPPNGACYNPNCLFTITVNENNAVTEGPQPGAAANNSVPGRCAG